MGVLQFDGATEQLKWTTLTSALSNTSDAAWTMAILCKITDLGHFHGLTYLLSGAGAGTTRAGMSYNSTTDQFYLDFGNTCEFPTDFLTPDQVLMLVPSKGAGTVTPRLGWKIGSAGAWTHENASGTQADTAAAVQIQIGTWQDTDNFEGWIGVVGWWEGEMSDANKEALDNNWRTSDWWNSAHGTPTFLAELNVAAASVTDLAGNASSLAVAGTPNLDAGETLDNWNFNGTGGMAPPRQSRPMRSRGISW